MTHLYSFMRNVASARRVGFEFGKRGSIVIDERIAI
jgi:hypothetical protein